MELSSFDGKYVRLTTKDGEVFDGGCAWANSEYGEHEFGVADELLWIDGWLFFQKDIQSVKITQEGGGEIWQNKTQHRMRLDPGPFDKIAAGQKTIELRLYDEKRRRIKPGDVIRFENSQHSGEMLRMTVQELYVFPSFRELYASLPLLQCGYTEETISSASPDDMNRYYSEEEQRKYGVAGIRIAPL